MEALLLLSCPLLAQVRVESLPEPGIQPQVIVDSARVRLVYLLGDPKACEVRYSTRPLGSAVWSAPIRVNSEPGSAIGLGTIRGAQMAIGRQGSVQVLWNGSGQPRQGDGPARAALWHARLEAGATGFGRQQNLLGDSEGQQRIDALAQAFSKHLEKNRNILNLGCCQFDFTKLLG